MTKSAYDQVYDGQWWRFQEGRSNRRCKIACCDCGKVHRFHVRIRDGVIEMRADVLPRETGGRRRALRIEKENDDA